jgi:hypothetical protein
VICNSILRCTLFSVSISFSLLFANSYYVPRRSLVIEVTTIPNTSTTMPDSASSVAAYYSAPFSFDPGIQTPSEHTAIAHEVSDQRGSCPPRPYKHRARSYDRRSDLEGGATREKECPTTLSDPWSGHNTRCVSSLATKESRPDRAAAPHGRALHNNDIANPLSPFLHADEKHDVHNGQHQPHYLLNRKIEAAASVFLVCGQFACIVVLRSYDLCGRATEDRTAHAVSPDHSTLIASSIAECDALRASLPACLHMLDPPSPTLFVLAALTWSGLAMLQYEINRPDRFQRSSLWAGLLTGLCISLPSLIDLEKPLVVSSSMAFSVTVALLCSQIGHGVCAMVCGSRCGESDAVDEKREGGA